MPVATAGPCYIPCNTFMPFMVVLFLMCASVATSQMPLLMIVLRYFTHPQMVHIFIMYELLSAQLNELRSFSYLCDTTLGSLGLIVESTV